MYVLSAQYSCAVVSVFLFGGKTNLVLLTLFYSTLLALTDRQTDRESNTLALRGLEEPFFQLCCCVVSVFGSGGKKVCLVGARSLIRPEKRYSHLSGGCVIVIRPEKKDTVVYLAGARSKNNDRKKRYSHLAVHIRRKQWGWKRSLFLP